MTTTSAASAGTIDNEASAVTFIVTEEQIADTFAQWEREIRETPDDFMSDDERLDETPEEWGKGLASEFITILEALV